MARTEEGQHRALREMAESWGVACGEAQASRLLAFGALLLTWSARINLTGARSMDVLLAEHYPDAFALAARLNGPLHAVDVGSGGGLPALPLALLRPALRIDLCEPLAKKGAFLRTAIRELGLSDRVVLRPVRGESLTGKVAFDAAFSRATFAPADWLELGQGLVRPGGRVFLLAAAGAVPQGVAASLYLGGRRAIAEVMVGGPPSSARSADSSQSGSENGPAADVSRGTSAEPSSAVRNVPRGTSSLRRRGV